MEEHKKKLVEDARLGALAGMVSEEILKDVILESLKTLFVEEVQRKVVEQATMVDGDDDDDDDN